MLDNIDQSSVVQKLIELAKSLSEKVDEYRRAQYEYD
jgi:hypothetical protein